MKVAALVERYLAWKADRVCPGTLRGYTQHVAWFEDVFGERDWGGLGRLDVLNALEASFRTAGGRKLAAATRNHRRNAFADLQRFAAKRVEPPLAAKLTPEDLQRETSASRQRFPTPAEFWRLLDAARPDARPVFQFLAFTGCRPDEACRARIQDIADRHDGRAIVLREHKTSAKTGAPRLIPVGGTHVAPLVAAAVGDRTAGPVFLTRLRRPWSRDNLSTLWRRARSAAGLGDDLVLYGMRHGAITHALEAGVSTKKVQRLSNHKDPKVLDGYAHLGIAAAEEASAAAAAAYARPPVAKAA